jgi:hypothetical protein
MDDIFDRLSKSTLFSSLDLKSGYWQVAVEENSIPKTAFSTRDGHYEFLRLPFGLRNAASEFSKIMKAIFDNSTYVEIYIDDIIIHSASFAEHLVYIKSVLENLKINRQKCT